MAEDRSQKTERATPEHKKKLREKGVVSRSAELSGWASLLVTMSLLPTLGGMAVGRIDSFVQSASDAMAHPTTENALAVLSGGLATFAWSALPIVLVATVVAVGAALAQVGLRFTPKALRVDVSRLSPGAGFRRIFAVQGVWSLVKTLLKMALLALVGFTVLRELIHGVLGAEALPLPAVLLQATSTVTGLLRLVGALALVLAAGDYAFQRRAMNRNSKMTKEEVKEERRRSDGNPHVRRAQRRKARQLTRRQMMAAVAAADVVVTNPTHYAVALAYNRATDRAPTVVAKGGDLLARAIREQARECHVPIVENPPLARTLFGVCEVDDVVPPHLYTAVARLLAFVYQLSPTAKFVHDVHVMAV